MSFNCSGLPTVALVWLVVALAAWWWRASRPKGKQAPCAPYYPILGHFLDFQRNEARIFDWFTDMFNAYGNTIMIRLPLSELTNTTLFIKTVDPANVEWMLKGNFDNYPKGPVFQDFLQDLLGNGIFNVDHKEWYAQRKAASKEFNVRIFREFMSDVFARHSSELCSIIRERIEKAPDGIIDMQVLFSKFTLQSIGEIGFGINLHCLEKDVPFEKAYDQATASSTQRFSNVFWKISRFLSSGHEVNMKANMRLLRAFSDHVIGVRRAEEDLDKRADLLSRFMLLTDPATGKEHDDKFLHDIVINFILAGRDTTSNALSWLFVLLSRNPRVATELRREIAAAGVGEKDTSFDALHHRNMPYLHATITEVLRLYPSVPSDPKYAQADDVLPSGHHVPRGAWLTYDPYCMGRMESLWGKDVQEFRPERFLEAGEGSGNPQTFIKPSPFKFTAFQAGRRVCLGMDMAYLEIKVAAVSLLEGFDFGIDPHVDPPITYTRSLTLPLNHLPMAVTPRTRA